jgi:predicted CXXCH cytochrome family protein
VRRLMFMIVAGALWLLLLAIPAAADGGPHIKGQFSNTPAECAGCHRAHSASAAYLTKQPMPDLCYACHGTGATGSVLDVQDGAAFSSGQAHVAGAPAGQFAGALRAGGFEYALINTADSVAGGRLTHIGATTAGVSTSSAHSVDGSPVTEWGQGPISGTVNTGTTVNLTCGSCHDPHGNGQYRILKPTPDGGSGTVYINDVASKLYTTSDYGQAGTYNSNDSLALNADGSSINYLASGAGTTLAGATRAVGSWEGTFAETSSQWCATCHTRYMGYRGSAGQLPSTAAGTGDAVYAYKHATRNLVDPNNPGAATTGLITAVNTGGTVSGTGTVADPYVANSGTLLPGAVLGCYASGAAGPDQIIYRGVAVLVGTSSSGANDCTYYGTGTASNRSGLAGSSTGRLDTTTISSGAPRCITCHLTHGSPALMSTLITDQTSPGIDQAGTPNLDSTLLRIDNRGVCMACHNQN